MGREMLTKQEIDSLPKIEPVKGQTYYCFTAQQWDDFVLTLAPVSAEWKNNLFRHFMWLVIRLPEVANSKLRKDLVTND